jgi:hypothetical protein
MADVVSSAAAQAASQPRLATVVATVLANSVATKSLVTGIRSSFPGCIGVVPLSMFGLVRADSSLLQSSP